MKSQKISFYKCLAIVAIILFCDQFLKVYIKLNFPLTIYGQDPIFDLGWFKLLFIENKGPKLVVMLTPSFLAIERGSNLNKR